MGNKKNILSTRTLTDELVALVNSAGMELDTVPFIQIVYKTDPATINSITQIAGRKAWVIFTSRHAVEVVTQQLTTIPDWQIASIGGATRQAAALFFGEEKIIMAAGTGQELATQLQELKPSLPVIFFAGNLRMDAVPLGLQSAGIALEEVTVYETMLVPQVLGKAYDAVLFFSPSAVESFFMANKLKTGAVCFTIGETTAAAIREKTSNTVIVGERHDVSHLVKKMIDYYT